MSELIQRAAERPSVYDILVIEHKAALDEIASLRKEMAGERDARHKCTDALRRKDEAMDILFERLRAAGVDFSDLIP